MFVLKCLLKATPMMINLSPVMLRRLSYCSHRRRRGKQLPKKLRLSRLKMMSMLAPPTSKSQVCSSSLFNGKDNNNNNKKKLVFPSTYFVEIMTRFALFEKHVCGQQGHSCCDAVR